MEVPNFKYEELVAKLRLVSVCLFSDHRVIQRSQNPGFACGGILLLLAALQSCNRSREVSCKMLTACE